MTSAILTTNINAAFPIPGRDNDSQSFRTNFGAIKTGLETAAGEISLLQAQKADLITQNFFSNATPATTTQTGSIVVAGGVGIGKDLFVGGQIIVAGSSSITTSTIVNSTNSEVIVTGTFGEPVYTIAPVIANNHLFTGKISIAQVSGTTSTQLYVTTTATNQTAGHFVGQIAQTVAIKLENSHGGNGENYSFIEYITGTNNKITRGTVKYYNSSMQYSGPTTFTSSTTFKENLTLDTGKNIRFADATVWIGDINQSEFDTANIKLGIGKFTLGGLYSGEYYGILAENPTLALASTDAVFIGNYVTGGLVKIDGVSASPEADGALSLGTNSKKWSVVWSNSGTIQTSDVRLKNNIEPLSLGLDFIKELNPVKYDLKSGSTNHWGLISQQVKEILESRGITDFAGLVEGDSEEKYLHLIYTEFIAPLINSVKDLAAENDQLKLEINLIKSHLGL